MMITRAICLRLGLCVSMAAAAACASSASKAGAGTGVTIIKNEPTATPTSGLNPDQENEARLVLQQREVTTRKCYTDVLNEKKDRNFQGTVRVLISLGTGGAATDVKPSGGTLGDKDVESCLVAAIRSFEFPILTQPGDVQYEFDFRPAY